MARLKKYMYQIDKTTIGFKRWWVLYQRMKYYFLSIVSGRSKQFNYYEIWRPNITADGCRTQCEECAKRDKQLN